jgi:hypothetical protein
MEHRSVESHAFVMSAAVARQRRSRFVQGIDLENIESIEKYDIGTRVFLLASALAMGGCASSLPPDGARGVERRPIAPGVEVVLSNQAGPEARRIAEDIERTYAAELISARPVVAQRIPAR